jgi:hypothetical protein
MPTQDQTDNREFHSRTFSTPREERASRKTFKLLTTHRQIPQPGTSNLIQRSGGRAQPKEPYRPWP